MRIWSKSFGKETKVKILLGEKLQKGLTMTETVSMVGMSTTFYPKAEVEKLLIII